MNSCLYVSNELIGFIDHHRLVTCQNWIVCQSKLEFVCPFESCKVLPNNTRM